MLIWKNTSTLDGYDDGLEFTNSKNKAQCALIGSKKINLDEFSNLKAIFRAGIGRDNVPEKEAKKKGILIRFPSKLTENVLFEETASFTCSLIFRMLYNNVGTLNPWLKNPRAKLSTQNLLIIGRGKIGSRVIDLMDPFIKLSTYDTLYNNNSDLKSLIQAADCISIHIPNTENNKSFFDSKKLSWMKNGATLINTARGPIVDEDALYEELKSKRLKAAFDVFWQEPYQGKLKKLYPEHFFMTPHIASTCSEFLLGCRNDLDELVKEITNN